MINHFVFENDYISDGKNQSDYIPSVEKMGRYLLMGFSSHMALCRYLVSFMFMFACNGRSGRVKWHYVMPFFCWFGMGHSLDFIALY